MIQLAHDPNPPRNECTCPGFAKFVNNCRNPTRNGKISVVTKIVPALGNFKRCSQTNRNWSSLSNRTDRCGRFHCKSVGRPGMCPSVCLQHEILSCNHTQKPSIKQSLPSSLKPRTVMASCVMLHFRFQSRHDCRQSPTLLYNMQPVSCSSIFLTKAQNLSRNTLQTQGSEFCTENMLTRKFGVARRNKNLVSKHRSLS